MDAWMPIDSAPKDRLIDIWIEGGDKKGFRWCDCYYDRICDQWRTAPGGLLMRVRAIDVKYWRDPPAPPAGTAREAGNG